MDTGLTSASQWRLYDRQTYLAKQRAAGRLRMISEIEELVEAGMSKSAAVAAVAQLKDASAASLWNWLRVAFSVPRYDRLAYLVPQHRGGGRRADIADEILEAIAADYLRPEKPSWAECVRRLEISANERGIALPNSRTLWRRFSRVFDAPVIALRRGEHLPLWLRTRIAANN